MSVRCVPSTRYSRRTGSTGWISLRWLHVIAAIAWIGASIYFVLLDQSLAAPKTEEDVGAGVGGELWEVHGGGFYHVQEVQGRAAACCPTTWPGSSGRRTRPGSRASP